VQDAWGTPVNLGPTVNTGGAFATSISADELELYFQSDRPGGYGGLDVWVTTRATTKDEWGTPVNLGPGINTSAWDNWPGISPDGLVLFFASNRSGGYGGWDLHMSRRTTKKDPWGPPVNLGPTINGAASEVHANVSYDGTILYFCPFRLGESDDLWRAPIIPAVDFNADGKVELADLVMLIDDWGTNKTLCDIGPMPWGDGKVDIEDLKVFMTYYEKENPPAKP
jgi:Tol biopolymer transport system component